MKTCEDGMSCMNGGSLRADLEASGQREWTPVFVVYRFEVMVELERASGDEVGCFACICCGEKWVGLLGWRGIPWRYCSNGCWSNTAWAIVRVVTGRAERGCIIT